MMNGINVSAENIWLLLPTEPAPNKLIIKQKTIKPKQAKYFVLNQIRKTRREKLYYCCYYYHMSERLFE
jgi:hypothetical protein